MWKGTQGHLLGRLWCYCSKKYINTWINLNVFRTTVKQIKTFIGGKGSDKTVFFSRVAENSMDFNASCPQLQFHIWDDWWIIMQIFGIGYHIFSYFWYYLFIFKQPIGYLIVSYIYTWVFTRHFFTSNNIKAIYDFQSHL